MKQANRMVGASVIGAAMLIGLSTPPAQAGYVVDLTQQGPNVVATGSGPIDLTGLSLAGSLTRVQPFIAPSVGLILTGVTFPAPSGDVYTGGTGPSSFGSG